MPVSRYVLCDGKLFVVMSLLPRVVGTLDRPGANV
jgi:hypothetical protein